MELLEQIGTNGTKWNLEQMEHDGTFRTKWNDWNNTERIEQNGKLEQMELLEQTEQDGLT